MHVIDGARDFHEGKDERKEKILDKFWKKRTKLLSNGVKLKCKSFTA